MKTTIIAVTLAMLAAGPAIAYAAPSAPSAPPTSTATTEYAKTRLPVTHRHTEEAATSQPQFVGPFELHDGLLPNQLTPTPFNYG